MTEKFSLGRKKAQGPDDVKGLWKRVQEEERLRRTCIEVVRSNSHLCSEAVEAEALTMPSLESKPNVNQDYVVLWDNEVLDMLCGATGCQKEILKSYVVELAKELEIELPQKAKDKIS